VNGGEGTSQYHTELAVAKFTGKRKKIPSGYFITTPRTYSRYLVYFSLGFIFLVLKRVMKNIFTVCTQVWNYSNVSV